MGFKILTDIQSDCLLSLFREGIGRLGYYLTGGTALSEFYLQHRHSDDLDLFTRQGRDCKQDFDNLSLILKRHGFIVVVSELSSDFARFNVYYPEKEEDKLKIELAQDVQAIMDLPKTHGEIIIDSFEDIAVNKICAILSREPPESKDFVDLFFILENSNYSIDYLLNRAKEKDSGFDNEYGILGFATNLLRVKEFQFLPKMIKPLTLEILSSRLLPIAYYLINRLRPATGNTKEK